MNKRADNAYNNIYSTVEGLDREQLEFFQYLFNSLPEDNKSVSELNSLMEIKCEELGLTGDISKFEKLTMFYIGFDQAIRSYVSSSDKEV